MVKKVITNLNLSKVSGPDCIPLVVLKNWLKDWNFIHTSWTLQYVSESLTFQIVAGPHWWSRYLKMLGKGILLKTTTQLVFFPWLVKSLKNLQIIGLWIYYRYMASFLTSSMVLGLLDQLQIFWKLYLIDLIALLRGLELLEL